MRVYKNSAIKAHAPLGKLFIGNKCFPTSRNDFLVFNSRRSRMASRRFYFNAVILSISNYKVSLKNSKVT